MGALVLAVFGTVKGLIEQKHMVEGIEICGKITRTKWTLSIERSLELLSKHHVQCDLLISKWTSNGSYLVRGIKRIRTLQKYPLSIEIAISVIQLIALDICWEYWSISRNLRKFALYPFYIFHSIEQSHSCYWSDISYVSFHFTGSNVPQIFCMLQ